MSANARVLVVGATADYVDELRRRFRGRLLFLTATDERRSSAFDRPGDAEEVPADLRDLRSAEAAVERHLTIHRLALGGLVCFDCESLAPAAALAHAFRLPFPSEEAVAVSRNKWAAKMRWQRAGVPCPDGTMVEDVASTLQAFRRIGAACIVKPLTGSGSELVFGVSTADECREAFAVIRARLGTHRDDRMYAAHVVDGRRIDPRHSVLIEERIAGPEYSCDFAVVDRRVTILRVAKKLFAPDGFVGRTLAYVVPGRLPDELDPGALLEGLRVAASALAIDRASCMADFIVSDGRPVLLELSPRPGGDCLPPLVWEAAGFDILACALDVAEGRVPVAPTAGAWRPRIGLRLFADAAGTIAAIDDRDLRRDQRVVRLELLPATGRTVALTNTYADDAYLGYAIVAPFAGIDVATQCRDLRAKLRVVSETRPLSPTNV
jgi:D-alanine-D-alanine ligase-like ATP-grasp enzyme